MIEKVKLDEIVQRPVQNEEEFQRPALKLEVIKESIRLVSMGLVDVLDRAMQIKKHDLLKN